MGRHTVLRIVARFIIPFILLYALYIQLHGEYSPGGGFQAGVIFAAAFILFCLIYGIEKTLKIISIKDLKILASFGALLYIGTGFFTMFMGANFLDYYAINEDPHTAQQIGIVVIELGVGITVFAAMMMIFALFVLRKTTEKPKTIIQNKKVAPKKKPAKTSAKPKANKSQVKKVSGSKKTKTKKKS